MNEMVKTNQVETQELNNFIEEVALMEAVKVEDLTASVKTIELESGVFESGLDVAKELVEVVGEFNAMTLEGNMMLEVTINSAIEGLGRETAKLADRVVVYKSKKALVELLNIAGVSVEGYFIDEINTQGMVATVTITNNAWDNAYSNCMELMEEYNATKDSKMAQTAKNGSAVAINVLNSTVLEDVVDAMSNGKELPVVMVVRGESKNYSIGGMKRAAKRARKADRKEVGYKSFRMFSVEELEKIAQAKAKKVSGKVLEDAKKRAEKVVALKETAKKGRATRKAPQNTKSTKVLVKFDLTHLSNKNVITLENIKNELGEELFNALNKDGFTSLNIVVDNLNEGSLTLDENAVSVIRDLENRYLNDKKEDDNKPKETITVTRKPKNDVKPASDSEVTGTNNINNNTTEGEKQIMDKDKSILADEEKVLANEQDMLNAMNNVANGEIVENFQLVEKEETNAEDLLLDGANVDEAVEVIESNDFTEMKHQRVLSRREIDDVKYFLLNGSTKEVIGKKSYPSISRLLVENNLHKDSKIAELGSNPEEFKIVVKEVRTTYLDVKYKYKKSKKIKKAKMRKEVVERKLVLDYDTINKFVEFNKTKIMSMDNITVTTLVNIAKEMKLKGLNKYNIANTEHLKELGKKDHTNDVEMAQMFINNINNKKYEARTLETHVKSLATSGSTRNIWERLQVGEFGNTKMICFSMNSKNVKVEKVNVFDENENAMKDEEGKLIEEYSLSLVTPKLDINGKPMTEKGGKIKTEIVLNAVDFYDFLDNITFEGKKLHFVIQSSSQDRLGSGFYALASNDEKEVENFLNVYSNGFYNEMKGREVLMKEIKRLAQDSSASKVMITREQADELNMLIVPNETLLLWETVLSPDTEGLSIKPQKKVIERTIGDGQGFFNGKVAALAALNASKITLKDFNRLKEVDFDFTNRRIAGIVKNISLAHQVRAAKGMLVYTDHKEMNRVLKESYTPEQLASLNGNVAPDFSKEFDIIFTESMIKGGMTIDKLSTIGHSKSSIEGTAKWSKINASFLMSYGATNKAEAVAELITDEIRKQLLEIMKGNAELSKCYDIQTDANAMNHLASALQILAVPGCPTLLLRQGQQAIDNLIKKGVSIELPGVQYCFIIDDMYATLSGCKEWTVTPEIKKLDMFVDKESGKVVKEVTDENKDKVKQVIEITGKVITRRGGKVTLLRNPHNGFNSIVCRESLKASEALTGNKAWMAMLFNQNIVMLSPDAIVYYLDGADFDGDKVMVIYEEDYPQFYVELNDFNKRCQKYMYPIYVENGIGKVARAKKMPFNIGNIHNAIKKSIALKNNVGRISERVTTLTEIRDIMMHNGTKVRKNEEGLSPDKLKLKLSQLTHEFDRVIELAVLGNAYNQAEIDKNLNKEKCDKFLDEVSKKVMFNGKELDVVGLEYRGKTAKGVLKLEECQSVPAIIYKRVEGLVQEVCMKMIEPFENSVARIKAGKATIFGKKLSECGIDTNRFADITSIDVDNNKWYSIYRNLDIQYNLRLQDIFSYVEETTKGDSEGFFKMMKEETARLTKEYTDELLDMIKDRDLAYAGIVYLIGKSSRRIERKFSDENLMDPRKVERLKDYKPEQGNRLPGSYIDGEDPITEEPRFKYVDGREVIRSYTSGTSFLYNVLVPGLIGLMPKVQLRVPEDTRKVIVLENKMFLVKENSMTGFESNMNFFKKVDGETGEELMSLVDLKPGHYDVNNGIVEINKVITESNGFTFRADKTVEEGNYIAEVEFNNYQATVMFKKPGTNTVVFKSTGLLTNTLAQVLNNDFARVQGSYKVYVVSKGGDRFQITDTKEMAEKITVKRIEKSKELTSEIQTKTEEVKNLLTDYINNIDEDYIDEQVIEDYNDIFGDDFGISNQELVNAITDEDATDVSDILESEKILGEQAEIDHDTSSVRETETIVVTKKEDKKGLSSVSDADLFNVLAHIVEQYAGESCKTIERDIAYYQEVLANRKDAKYASNNFKSSITDFRMDLDAADMNFNMKTVYEIVESIIAEMIARKAFEGEYNVDTYIDSVETVVNALGLM